VWDDLKRYTEGFVRCCEEGDFTNLSNAMNASLAKLPKR
jgi:hypothetical protein